MSARLKKPPIAWRRWERFLIFAAVILIVVVALPYQLSAQQVQSISSPSNAAEIIAAITAAVVGIITLIAALTINHRSLAHQKHVFEIQLREQQKALKMQLDATFYFR